ncbi:MAG: imidazoleglycerol-phosphate dehydratase [Candidatus Omnitrophota bacterium]
MRKAEIQRKTNEVDIKGKLAIDGSGKTGISTGFEPLNHLLTLFAFHGFFDLELKAKGDLAHHIIEDLGIALGKAFKEALGDKKGIKRYGSFSLVMDETVVEANVDISGRPVFHQRALANIIFDKNSKFDDTNFSYEDAEGFLKSFAQHAGVGLVCVIKSDPEDLHHLLEALFKALGKALDEASQIDPRRKGVPSTKGIID